MNKTLLLYTIAAIAATGGLLFGFDTGVINVALPFIKHQWDLSAEAEAWAVSAVLVGGMAGSLLSGRLADALGRKRINLVASLVFVIGSVITAVAPSPDVLIAGRLLLGLAIGIVSFSVPLYIAEIAPSEIRGRLVTFFQLAITIGILISYLVGFAFAESENGWRLMFWTGFIPAAILFGGMFFVPESPRWLVSKGRDEEARAVLNRLHETDKVELEFSQIKKVNDEEKTRKVDWRELFSSRLRIPLLIGIGIFLIQQFSGINAVIYYSTRIFGLAGFNSNTTAIMATVGVGVVNTLSTLVAVRFLDQWGRKPLLYTGLIGTAISLATISFAFFFRESLGADLLKILSVGGVYVYIFFFAISLGPLGWLLISEVYPLRIRGFATSLGSFYHWFFDFWVSFTFPLLAASALGTNGGIFMIYTGVCLVGLLFARFIVFETKGMSLEDIEKKWQ
ncbi:sugar porter family MFS transporter [Tellurirhabdus rosea]|uniref:sugar porter family MFS transporter n=1 Tax=Tellurirhabdus rosea TaxID=2674997 RepID=UPI002250716C|nr:sugar porter family MFS transporter [Tellurirhabdus rosea]